MGKSPVIDLISKSYHRDFGKSRGERKLRKTKKWKRNSLSLEEQYDTI
jgi:hypothetical protein